VNFETIHVCRNPQNKEAVSISWVTVSISKSNAASNACEVGNRFHYNLYFATLVSMTSVGHLMTSVSGSPDDLSGSPDDLSGSPDDLNINASGY
jgi:hypothetical protein